MPISLDGLVLCHCKSGADEAGQRAPCNAVGERESRHHLHAGCRLSSLRYPPSLSRKTGQPPVLTSPNRLSTLPQRFARARLSQSYLPKSCSDFSATFTTMACMGFSLSSGFRAAISLSCYLDRFLCSIWNPVSSPRPAVLQKPTRAGAVKVGRRTNLSTPSAPCQAIP